MDRVLPDVDRMLALHLNMALAATVSNHLPADVLSQMPYVRVAAFGGAVVHPRFGGRYSVDLDAWESTRKKAADLLEDARMVIVTAWGRQTQLAGGSITRILSFEPGSELRTADQLSSVYRYTASGSLFVRP